MPIDEPLYPVFLRLAERRCLVVGAGPIATQKAAGLVSAAAIVTMVAPEISDAARELAARPSPGEMAIVERRYRRDDIEGMTLVITATDDPAVNAAVADDATSAGVLVNSADDPDNCSFVLPARAKAGPLEVTVSTAGHSPAVAVWLRDQIQAQISDGYDELLEVVSEVRAEIRDRGHSSEGLPWQMGLDSGILEEIRNGRREEAKARLRALVAPPAAGHVSNPGKEHRSA